MSIPKKKVHKLFDAKYPWAFECGVYPKSYQNKLVTDNNRKVTCKRCRERMRWMKEHWK